MDIEKRTATTVPTSLFLHGSLQGDESSPLHPDLIPGKKAVARQDALSAAGASASEIARLAPNARFVDTADRLVRTGTSPDGGLRTFSRRLGSILHRAPTSEATITVDQQIIVDEMLKIRKTRRGALKAAAGVVVLAGTGAGAAKTGVAERALTLVGALSSKATPDIMAEATSVSTPEPTTVPEAAKKLPEGVMQGEEKWQWTFFKDPDMAVILAVRSDNMPIMPPQGSITIGEGTAAKQYDYYVGFPTGDGGVTITANGHQYNIGLKANRYVVHGEQARVILEQPLENIDTARADELDSLAKQIDDISPLSVVIKDGISVPLATEIYVTTLDIESQVINAPQARGAAMPSELALHPTNGPYAARYLLARALFISLDATELGPKYKFITLFNGHINPGAGSARTYGGEVLVTPAAKEYEPFMQALLLENPNFTKGQNIADRREIEVTGMNKFFDGPADLFARMALIAGNEDDFLYFKRWVQSHEDQKAQAASPWKQFAKVLDSLGRPAAVNRHLPYLRSVINLFSSDTEAEKPVSPPGKSGPKP